MIVYIDLIILSNFLLDYSLITFTGIINHEKMKFYRLFLATLFALLSLGLFFIQIKIIFILLRVLFSILIILIAFPFISLKQYMRNIIVFYFLNYVMAGILLSYDFKMSENAIFIDHKNPITWYLLVVSFIFSNILTYTFKVIEENKLIQSHQLLDVMFCLLNQEYHVKGFIDTGNRVCSPYDQIPVVFIDKTLIKENINEDFLIKHHIKFTYVLTNTIHDSVMTLAFKPDKFYLIINKQRIQKEVYLAVAQNLKFKEQSFQVILNSKILI